MSRKYGKIIADVSNRNFKLMKWLLTIGAFIGAIVAIFATRFSMATLITVVFLANVFLFSIAGILSYLYFSSREIILYENGMKIPYTRFSSKYINYNEIKSIHPYARGGAVRIEANGVSLKIPKGHIERWNEFIEFVRNKGLINEKEDVKTFENYKERSEKL